MLEPRCANGADNGAGILGRGRRLRAASAFLVQGVRKAIGPVLLPIRLGDREKDVERDVLNTWWWPVGSLLGVTERRAGARLEPSSEEGLVTEERTAATTNTLASFGTRVCRLRAKGAQPCGETGLVVLVILLLA